MIEAKDGVGARAEGASGKSGDGLIWDRLAWALFILAALLVILTFRDYGVTWDEDVHQWYGVFVLDYYLSFFRDLRALHWGDLYNYGAAFDMTAAALDKISPFGIYATRHLLNGLVGVLGIIGTWKLGRALAGPRAGFIAALFLLLTPNYYGQMFNNPKDVPFAVGMAWALYYLVRIIPELPRPPAREVLKLGLATGMALGIRVGGLLLFGYTGLVLLLFVIWRSIEARRATTFLTESWTGFWRVLLPLTAVAYPVMLAFWPWAQRAPFTRPLQTLAYFSHEIFPYRTLFDGNYVWAARLPWSYLPTYIVLALPELVLLLLAAAPVVAVAVLAREGRSLPRSQTLQRFIVGFVILFPVAYAVAIRAVLFDGMRHFIFVLPPIAALAALIADRGLTWLEGFRLRRLAYAALAAYGLFHVSIMARLHPDEYVYYNALTGGVPGAAGLFKLDYWANSYAEDVRGLEHYLRAEYGAAFSKQVFTVAVCGPAASAAAYFPKNFIYTKDRQQAEFFIAFTKDDCNKAVPGQVVYRVERLDTLLSEVIDRRAILARESRSPLVAGTR